MQPRNVPAKATADVVGVTRKLSGVLSLAMLAVACSTDPLRIDFESEGLGRSASSDDRGVGGLEDAGESPAPASCEVFPNDCGDRAHRKCTLIASDPGFRSACVEPVGNRPLGGGCERQSPGNDNCRPGGFCTLLGQPLESDDDFSCRRLCASTAGCSAGQRCLPLESEEDVGLCVEPCRLFESDCGFASLRCLVAADVEKRFFAYCDRYGANGEGEPCTSSTECADGFGCESGGGRCRAICDAEHPCPADLRCIPLALGDAEAPRLCVP